MAGRCTKRDTLRDAGLMLWNEGMCGAGGSDDRQLWKRVLGEGSWAGGSGPEGWRKAFERLVVSAGPLPARSGSC